MVQESKEFKNLKERYKKEKNITLDCFCISKEINDVSEIDIENAKCHGEIIAYFLLKEVE